MLLFAAVTSAAFRGTQLVTEPVQTHKFTRQVQIHTFPARCGATTGCSLDSRGKAVRPAQIKQLTSASASSQYMTNVTRLTAKRISTHHYGNSLTPHFRCNPNQHAATMQTFRPRLHAYVHLQPQLFPPKLPRSNEAVSRESPCRQCFHKLLAPILLSTSASYAKVTTELLTPGDCMLYAYASVSRMQGWPAHMQQ